MKQSVSQNERYVKVMKRIFFDRGYDPVENIFLYLNKCNKNKSLLANEIKN